MHRNEFEGEIAALSTEVVSQFMSQLSDLSPEQLRKITFIEITVEGVTMEGEVLNYADGMFFI